MAKKTAAKEKDILGTKTGKKQTSKQTKSLKHEFSDDEKKSLADDMSEKIKQKNIKELELKEVKSVFKAELDALDAQISTASQKYNCGFEMRDTDCVITFHKPKQGMKTVMRTDTLDIVETVKMSHHECQDLLPLDSK